MFGIVKRSGIKAYGRKVFGKFWHFIHFHKTIHFKTLKECLDFEQGWWPVILFDLGLFYPGFFSPIGFSVELTKPEDFDEEQIARSHSKNLTLLSQEVKGNLNRKVKLQFHENKLYWLRGLEITHEDFYYILEDEAGKKLYEPCVSKVEFVGK